MIVVHEAHRRARAVVEATDAVWLKRSVTAEITASHPYGTTD